MICSYANIVVWGVAQQVPLLSLFVLWHLCCCSLCVHLHCLSFLVGINSFLLFVIYNCQLTSQMGRPHFRWVVSAISFVVFILSWVSSKTEWQIVLQGTEVTKDNRIIFWECQNTFRPGARAQSRGISGAQLRFHPATHLGFQEISGSRKPLET